MIEAKRHSASFIGISRDEKIDLLLERISRICKSRKNPKLRVTFTAGIDATAIVKEYQVSRIDHTIVGGASPNDFIPADGLSKEQIF